MKLTLIKRVMTLPGGIEDVSMVAAFGRDEKLMKSLPVSTPMEFDSDGSSKDGNIGKYIVLRNFFLKNCPERYVNINEFTEEESPVWASTKVFDQWLAIEVGWCYVSEVDGVTTKYARRYDTKTEKDRIAVNTEFFVPATKKMATMLDMEVYDMIQASINSSRR